MTNAILYDVEFLVSPGAPQRFWCGPRDPDPVIAQIGAVKIALAGDFEIIDTYMTIVRPKDRFGAPAAIDPFFSTLTGLTAERIAKDGVPLAQALDRLKDFADETVMWSWGKDEINMIAISCYLEGIAPPIPARQFGNACRLLLKAGMPYDDLIKTRSNTLAAYFGLPSDHTAHDALGDAMSVTDVVRHLLHTGALQPGDFSDDSLLHPITA